MAGNTKNINKVSIRMYCIGTGDCFVLKFYSGNTEKFNMMIDCGSCHGTANEFIPYITDLREFVKKRGIDLLIVTHEHQDHVNGFQKCKDIFKDIKIGEAWFAWTEEPGDPNSREAELLKKRNKLRLAFTNAMDEFRIHKDDIENNFEGDYNLTKIKKANTAFMNGLSTLADINLSAMSEANNEESLPGMLAIKEKLRNENVEVKYLNPGEIKKLTAAPGLNFYILGPPWERNSVFKDGKEGTDVYKKYLSLNQSMLSAESFMKTGDEMKSTDLPFDLQYTFDDPSNISTPLGPLPEYSIEVGKIISEYHNPKAKWRNIDYDWLTSVGSLAIRLNKNLNNTSLALAIEFEESGNVLLFPGDAEFGNWESWHLIEKWDKKGKNGKHLAEDLLNRTVFYKSGHHLSYNGTALAKGINMMPLSGMTAMVPLDRTRISPKWKSTMPNKLLLEDLIKRCDGKVFIMSEDDILNPPSKKIDLENVKGYEYDRDNNLYKQFTLKF
jgi:beta-lactamase superfamily II metal-dependent hydrolase